MAPLVSSLLLAALLGTAADPLVVVDETGAPVSGAAVAFADASGARDAERTDAAGHAAARAGFVPVTVVVSKPGYEDASENVARAADARIVLLRRLPVVGSVSVATGSASSLHALPLAASLLDRSAVALAQAAALDGVLRQLPGNDQARSNAPFTNYGLLRASFSGAGTDRGVVLVDGIPAQDGFGGQIDWLAYPSDVVERAELLRGAGSALYGSGGVGGVLNVTTFGPRTGAGVTPDGRLDLGVGTNDRLDDGIAVRAPVGAHIAASVSSVATRLAYLDLPPAYAAPDDTSAVSESASTQARVRYDDGVTTVDAGGLFASDHQFEGRPNYTFDRTFRQESVGATRRLGEALAQFAYYNRDATVYNLADQFPAKPGVLRYMQHVPTNESGFFGQLFAQPGTTQLTLRVDQRQIQGTSEQNAPDSALQALGSGNELEQGIALQGTFRAPRFEAVAGARADGVRYQVLSLYSASTGTTTSVPQRDEGAISPRAALRYDLTPRLALRVSSGGGFRAPYLNELVRGYQIAKTVFAPNPGLVPERSLTDGAGLDYLVGRGRVAFDVLETQVHDAIAFATLGPTLMKRENFDRTQTDGETLSYTQAVATCARVRFAGTTQNPRVTTGPAGTVGKQLPYVPNRTASLGLEAGEPRGPLSVSVDGSYAGQTYADDLNQEPLGAALLFGGTVRATTADGTTFSLAGENLTHQTYLSSIDRYGPPLTVSLRVGIPIGPRTRTATGCALGAL